MDRLSSNSYFEWKWLLLMTLVLSFTSCSDDDDLLPEDLTPWYEDMTSLKADFAKALADAQ